MFRATGAFDGLYSLLWCKQESASAVHNAWASGFHRVSGLGHGCRVAGNLGI